MDPCVKLLAFAGVRDVIGAAELAFPVPSPCTARELLELVCARYPGIAPWRASIRVAVNGTYAALDDAIAARDEVALIPPVAGG
jgi:molybdopterin converting factor subunit 1